MKPFRKPNAICSVIDVNFEPLKYFACIFRASVTACHYVMGLISFGYAPADLSQIPRQLAGQIQALGRYPFKGKGRIGRIDRVGRSRIKRRNSLQA